jgi:hypothetical protein
MFRKYGVQRTVVPSGAADALVRVPEMAMGAVELPTGSTLAGEVTFLAGHDHAAMLPVVDEGGTTIAATLVAGACVPIPPEALIFGYFRMVFATPPAADETFYFHHKS